MLVIIDIEQYLIYIYTKNGMQTLSLDQIEQIQEAIGDNLVYYVTNAVEADGPDIINLVNGLSGKPAMSKQSYDNGVKYLKSNLSGLVIIPNPEAKGEEAKIPLITFNGKNDCRPYDEEMVNKSSLLKTLIQNKKIEIVGSSGMKNALEKYQKENLKKLKKHKDAEDKQLSSIILDKPVSQFDPFENSDVETIDIESDVMGGYSDASEAENLIKKMGLGKGK